MDARKKRWQSFDQVVVESFGSSSGRRGSYTNTKLGGDGHREEGGRGR